jgi:peptide-methionine (S)-S-oxide reductase
VTRQSEAIATVGFGGGCHWCTEAVFASLRGIARVDQGFIRSTAPDDTWSEAVRIAYDQNVITLDVLTEIHLRTHASTSNHKMRGKYRSAVYTTSEPQSVDARRLLSRFSADYDEPLVTRALPLVAFRSSDARYQRYFEKHADGPFCANYIDPKLALLRKDYVELAI